jgi:hypothetical protein
MAFLVNENFGAVQLGRDTYRADAIGRGQRGAFAVCEKALV